MEDDVEVDWTLEWKLRAAAVPVAFLLALAFHASSMGHFFQRTFLTMVPHELGHAIAAWWCGFTAVPTLWKTLIPESRGWLAPLAIGAAELALVVRGWTGRRDRLVVLGLALAALQVVGTTASPSDALAAITFAGDAGAMILGSLLVLAFFAPIGSRLRAGGLRWGLLAIGAAAFVDTFATWWSARHDLGAIPFGELEGIGLSDPSKLQEVYGWPTGVIVGRFVDVGATCIAVLIAAWLVATWRAHRATSAA